MDALHYFHYGQLVHDGQAIGDPRVLAKSSGIDDEFISLVLATAKVPPLTDSSGVSWGLIRTRRGRPMTFARVEQGSSYVSTYQFIKISSDAVRELAGNFAVLSEYLTSPLKEYAMLGDDLAPIKLGDVSIATDTQVDNLLDLMSYARNNTRNIQPLIAAVISGTPLIIINAPKDGDIRMGFVQGLLMLLPSSTRLGVTFLLHSTPETKIRAQVQFWETAPSSDEYVIYDWETASVSGKEVKNDYSRFITSQMRLDPELVTRETEKLTKTAGWRFNSGDNLADALDYASHRSKVDKSLQNGMPVEVSSVAKILGEDPTLSDEFRLMYARHLINFSLALDDLQYVDAITATMHQHKEIEREVLKYMAKALEDGQGAIIFETLVRWQENPFSPTGRAWQQLLAKAALSELDELIEEQDAEMIADYLDDVQALGSQATPIIGRVIDRVLPMASREPSIPTKILLLAMQNLDDTKLQALMSTPRFVRPLPSDVKRMLALFAQRDRKAPPGTMIRAVQGIPPSEQTSALIVFVKQAYANQRIDLIDERILNELVKALNVNPTLIDADLLTGIAESVQNNTLSAMKRPAPRLVLQLVLLSQNYIALDTLLIAQSRDIYGANGQRDYIASIQETFAKTTIAPQDAMKVYDTFVEMEMAEIPLIATILGLLEGTSWHADLKSLADRAMKDIADEGRLLEALPAQTFFSLLQYVARQGDARRIRIVTRLMGSCAARERGKAGLTAANQAYKFLDSNTRTRPYALEVVRQYIREADEKPAQHMIKFYGDRLGKEIAEKLQVSYDFSHLMARMDWLTYVASVQMTVNLLQAMVNNYSGDGGHPNLGDVRLQVENFRRALSVSEHRDLSEDLRKLAHAIVVLGQRHGRRSSTSDKHIEAVARGKNDPRSVLDIFRSAGGHLLDQSPYPFRILDGDSTKPMGDEYPEDLRITISIASTIMDVATNAFSTGRDMWTTEVIIDELNSQTVTLSDVGRANLQQVGRNLQRLADLVIHIAGEGNTKVIEVNHNKGRKLEKLETAPENSLELMRAIYGYFAST